MGGYINTTVHERSRPGPGVLGLHLALCPQHKSDLDAVPLLCSMRLQDVLAGSYHSHTLNSVLLPTTRYAVRACLLVVEECVPPAWAYHSFLCTGYSWKQ